MADDRPRDAAYWAGHVETLKVGEVPAGVININVDGRRVVGPLQGFGALWQKTYQVRLRREGLTPAEIVRVWKERFPEFQPPQNRFYLSVVGVAPGETDLGRLTAEMLRVVDETMQPEFVLSLIHI